jgi:hypothetical protein
VQRLRRIYTPGKSNLNNPSKTRRRRDSFLGRPGDKRPGFKLPVSANRFRHLITVFGLIFQRFAISFGLPMHDITRSRNQRG